MTQENLHPRGEQLFDTSEYQVSDSSSMPDPFDRLPEEAIHVEGQQPIPLGKDFIDFNKVRIDDYSDQLYSRIENMFEEFSLFEAMAKESKYDALTGLLTRQAFTDVLAGHIATQDHIVDGQDSSNDGLSRKGDMEKLGLATMFIDLDRFKFVNDTFGHEAGDRALILAAEAIKDSIRPGDAAARYGGDEFLVVLNEGITLEDAQRVEERIKKKIEDVKIRGEKGLIGASIGIMMYQEGSGIDAAGMILESDESMYHDKKRRKADSRSKVALNLARVAGIENFVPTTDDPLGEVYKIIHKDQTGQRSA